MYIGGDVMKKMKYFIILFGIVSIFLVGCSNGTAKEEQYITVQNHNGEENKYDDINEITDNDQVQKVEEILSDSNWVKSIVDMVRPADYRFIIAFKNPKIKAVPIYYELWISPNMDKVELVLDTEHKYVQLDKSKSAELFKILTGKELSDLK